MRWRRPRVLPRLLLTGSAVVRIQGFGANVLLLDNRQKFRTSEDSDFSPGRVARRRVAIADVGGAAAVAVAAMLLRQLLLSRAAHRGLLLDFDLLVDLGRRRRNQFENL